MSNWLDLARMALRLHRRGKTRLEIKAALKLDYAKQAQNAIDAGFYDEVIEGSRLSWEELKILRYLAHYERENLERGGRAGILCNRRQLYLIRKRLDTHRKGEPEFVRGGETFKGTGLGLVHCYHGGLAYLSPTGWALVHALEAMTPDAR